MKDTPISYSGKVKAEDGTMTEYNGEVTASMPTTIEEAIEKYGADVVLSKCNASVTIDLQRVARSSNGDNEEAQKAVDTFVPGVARPRTGGGMSQKAILTACKGMSEAELTQLLADVAAKTAAATA